MPAPPPPRFVSEQEIRRLVGAEQRALAAVRGGIVAQASGAATQPPPFHLGIERHHGELHVKGAYLHEREFFVVKMATGFFDNPARGLPSSGGMFLIFDATTGVPVLVVADNGYLTDLRTGLAGAISIDALAHRSVDTVAVLGTGTQARHQVRALLLVRHPRRLSIWGRDGGRAEAFCHEASEMAGWQVSIAGSIAEATSEADVVITTTPATTPLLHAHHLSPGVHVTAVGSDGPGKRELDASVLDRASLVVADDPDQSTVRGELQARPDLADTTAALGDVLRGCRAGRTADTDITVCDLIGIGAEDAAIGGLVAELLMP